MVEYKVRERREMGTNPYPNIIYFTKEDDLLITQTIADIAKEDDLKILAYNICADHIHLLLVCDIDEIPAIMQKIKGRSSFVHNNKGYDKGLKPLAEEKKQKNKPLWQQKYSAPKEVTSQEQFHNTINYIQNNRHKHGLPAHSKTIENIITTMCCDIDTALKPKYIGGFDVVIGNPPYVFARDNISQEHKNYYNKNYISAEYQVNTYLLFIEKTIKLIRKSANFGLIIPNSWLMVSSAKGLRNFILQNCIINGIVNLEGYSFEGVNVETIIIIAKKVNKKLEKNSIKVFLSDDKEFKYSHSRNQIDFENNEGLEFRVFSDEISVELTKKIKSNSTELDDLVYIKAGLQAYEKNKGEPKQTAEDVKNRPFDFRYKYDNNTHKYIEGKDVRRYSINWSGNYLQYGKQLAAPRTFNLFDGEKIIIREITGKYPKSIIATFSDKLFLYNRSNIGIIEKESTKIKLKYLILILNSQIMAYYFIKNTAKSVRKMFPKIILNDLRKFPIKEISFSKQQPFIEKADTMLSLNKELQEITQKFQRNLQRKFVILEKLPKKLQNWYTLSFTEFIKELKKKKIKLTLSEEAEWEDYFIQEQQKAQDLKSKIDQTDVEIDLMVYQLYGLTDKEIAIVEAS